MYCCPPIPPPEAPDVFIKLDNIEELIEFIFLPVVLYFAKTSKSNLKSLSCESNISIPIFLE